MTAALLSFLLVAVFAGVANAAGLDRSYGEGGVVKVPQPVTSGLNSDLLQFASARDGSVYALAQTRTCGSVVCVSNYYLYRFTAGGALDTGFGAGGIVLLPGASGEYGLAVDARGRALLAAPAPGSVTVLRYLPNGRPDPSFSGGQVTVGCDCEGESAWVMPAARGRVLVESRGGYSQSGEPSSSRVITLNRLLASGSPDRGFGKAGGVTVRLGRRITPGQVSVTRKGAVVFGASGCCGGNGAYLMRVSARGRLDARFGRRAGRSLQRLRKSGEQAGFASLVPRGDGALDIFGTDPLTGGFDFRLAADGAPAKFGKGGLRRLPFTIDSAVAGTGGADLILGNPLRATAYEEVPNAYRMLGDGRLDPAFGGGGGLRLPLSGTGVSLAALKGGRAQVMNLGAQFCRSGCGPTPGFARLVEGQTRR
ncbi:MAG TPA: hypothetical protein VMF55_16845 [Solirubrobacterales bacterium]|nr:hypothetical protein [Solirubrobacterales bacterium]